MPYDGNFLSIVVLTPSYHNNFRLYSSTAYSKIPQYCTSSCGCHLRQCAGFMSTSQGLMKEEKGTGMLRGLGKVFGEY